MVPAALPQGFTWVLAGMAVLMVLTIVQKARIGRRKMGVDLGSERGRDEGERRARESLDEIFVRLQEFSRDTLSRLDSKVRVLNELVSRAEARIEELKKLQGGTAPGAADPPAARPANPLHEKVFRLRDEGRTPVEIGETTGLQRGEVELILGLREPRA